MFWGRKSFGLRGFGSRCGAMGPFEASGIISKLGNWGAVKNLN